VRVRVQEITPWSPCLSGIGYSRTVPDLPTQLPWRRFVCVLHRLGYVPQKAGRGSVRVFFNASREPHTVSFLNLIPATQWGRPSCARASASSC
jgi:hypothetical protein